MEFPFLLLVLLALPFVAAAVIVGVSMARRRRDTPASGSASAPVHRFQSDTAAVQDATDHPATPAPEVSSGRERRAAAASARRENG